MISWSFENWWISNNIFPRWVFIGETIRRGFINRVDFQFLCTFLAVNKGALSGYSVISMCTKQISSKSSSENPVKYLFSCFYTSLARYITVFGFFSSNLIFFFQLWQTLYNRIPQFFWLYCLTIHLYWSLMLWVFQKAFV